MLRFLAGLVVGVLIALPAPADSDASVDCEHRGMEHIQRHGGKLEDDRFHIAHGERVTCDGADGARDHRGDDHPEERREPAGHDDHHNDDGHLGRDKHRWWRND